MNTRTTSGSLCHRREFLKMALAGSAGLVGLGALGRLRGAPAASLATSADVIIVGAGMAGMSAASRLLANGVKPIVLEGRDRIGGRIHTQEVGGLTVDLGAGWIMAAESNPLADVAEEFGFETVEATLTDFTLRHPNGTPYTDKEMVVIGAAFASLAEGMLQLAARRQRYYLPDISMQQAVDKVLDQQALSPKMRENVCRLAAMFFGVLRGTTLEDASFYYSNTDRNFGLTDVVLPGGFGQVTDALSEGVDIRLQHVVKSIDYGRRGVTIETNHGAYTADRAILTFPLAVLQSNTVDFSPGLPLTKKRAIKALKVGPGNKYYLRFPTTFWNTDVISIVRLSNDLDRSGFINSEHWMGLPVICALVEGNYAIESEGYSDDKIISDLMDSLRAAFGKSIPDPVPGFLARSRWHSDPFSRGMYAHVPVGGTLHDYVTLGEPVDNRLFFAGDATNKDFPGSTRAAYVSGQKAADKVMKFVKG